MAETKQGNALEAANASLEREFDRACANTDRELWRESEGDYYADSIHVNQGGGIGINCGGYVIVKPLRDWHALAIQACDHQWSDPRKDAPYPCACLHCGTPKVRHIGENAE